MDEQILYYAGIGARATPEDVQDVMTHIAREQYKKGRQLRSGGAKGADSAFEAGARDRKQIFKPNYWVGNKRFEISEMAYVIAAKHHDIWPYLPQWHKDLMARNVHVILGPNLDDPVDHVICWTTDGIYQVKDRTKKSGGTGHAISVACENDIPVFNLNNKTHYKFVMQTLIK